MPATPPSPPTLSTPFVLLDASPRRRRAVPAWRTVALLALLGVVTLTVPAVRQAVARRLSTHTLVWLGFVAQPKWSAPAPVRRCSWVVEQTMAHNQGKSAEALKEQFDVQATDVNTFYRATALLFWKDFVQGGWGLFDLSQLGVPTTQADGTPLQRTSTWTWITGDQHLSNFGAWKNRNNAVIFGINDFDEAAIYDFQIDVWRCAVSIYDHALANGLGTAKATAAVLTFTDSYLATLQRYVGNEDALLFEVTQAEATGKLRGFLSKIDALNSEHKMLTKYTTLDEGGTRRFVKGKQTHLQPAAPAVEAELRAAFARDTYGATMTKIGWHAREWSGSYFHVLDVAARVGSGVGSYGVGRYYVLLAGGEADARSGANAAYSDAVILDVKAEPQPAVAQVLGRFDMAWYRTLFANEAARSVQAQRRLTSYTDPFAGWVTLNGTEYLVRQRSPWKAGFGLEELRSYADLAEFVQQIAVITATSHARGTVGKSPGQFKQVVSAALGAPFARATWGISVGSIAAAYREQVLLDYACFSEWHKAGNYSARP